MPATGKCPKPASAASWAFRPRSCMGRRASRRALVDRAPVRLTELMSGMYSFGITPGASVVLVVVGGSAPAPGLGAAPAGAGAAVVEGAGGTVVVGSSLPT